MTVTSPKFKIGIVGCGAIGSRIAQSVQTDLKKYCVLAGAYDIVPSKVKSVEKKLSIKNIAKKSLPDLIEACDLVVEAVASTDTRAIIQKILQAKKSVLVMSIGQLLEAQDLFTLAERQHCHILVPSGAVSGIDALKAASLVNISSATLTTRKHPSGLSQSPYIREQNIDLSTVQSETVIFDGSVKDAVKWFPANINVAATIALSAQLKDKLRVRIVVSPKFSTNSHELDVTGEFGRMVSRTDNVVCPDNPKTSYLAVLSAVQTLKQYFQFIKIGT